MSIFELAGTKLSTSVSAIVLAIVQITGSAMTAYFVDRIGRKILMCASLIGCTIGLSTMGIYLYLDNLGINLHYFNWVPLVALATVVLVSSLGISPLTNIYVVETMPAKVFYLVLLIFYNHFFYLILFI